MTKPGSITTIPRLILSYLGTMLIIGLVTILLKVVERSSRCSICFQC